MITIDFSTFIALFLSVTLLLVIGQWILYNRREEAEDKKSKYIMRCPYCSHIFYNFKNKELKICPRCNSYVEKDN